MADFKPKLNQLFCDRLDLIILNRCNYLGLLYLEFMFCLCHKLDVVNPAAGGPDCPFLLLLVC